MMAVYFDASVNALFVGQRAYPAQWLVASASGDSIEIWIANQSSREAGPMGFGMYARRDGSSFATAVDAMAYLNSEFVKTPNYSPPILDGGNF